METAPQAADRDLYSPECVEEVFSNIRQERISRSSPNGGEARGQEGGGRTIITQLRTGKVLREGEARHENDTVSL
jgi:hypothetical protein